MSTKPLTSMHRDADTQAAYLAYNEQKQKNGDTSCDMCRLIATSRVDFSITDSVTGATYAANDFANVCIIENEFPYAIHDGRKPLAHHLLVPVAHYATNSDLPTDVKNELTQLQSLLLDNGVYHSALVRSTYNPAISVPGHLHIHLVRLGSKVIKQDYDGRSGKNVIVYESE